MLPIDWKGAASLDPCTRSAPAMQYRPAARPVHSLILFNPCLFLQTLGLVTSNPAPARVS
ncbi:hypothetical protein CR51_37930 [Caballeronia megalochromosomata]|nr:hypothetical protein CR51_37930 [Caballeronia megalochromosomata]